MTTESTDALQCGNPDCKVGQTQKCVEGLPLDSCPHFGKQLQPRPAPGASEAENPPGVPLPSGDLLDAEDASQVLRRGESRLIAIVGPKEVGKTTLIASVFELFLRGAIGACQFAKSRTLFAFERSCHPSRALSLNIVPKTERTRLTDVHFYHIRLRAGSGPLIDMLFADRPGEDYRLSADDPSSASGFVEVQRADVITFLVDGSQLLNLTTRQSIAAEVIGIAQALIDGDAIDGLPRAALVLTKVDAIDASPDRDRAKQDFRSLAARFKRLFGERFLEIQEFEVAACPANTRSPRGLGVPDLLKYWHEQPVEMTAIATLDLPLPARFMHRLMQAPE